MIIVINSHTHHLKADARSTHETTTATTKIKSDDFIIIHIKELQMKWNVEIVCAQTHAHTHAEWRVNLPAHTILSGVTIENTSQQQINSLLLLLLAVRSSQFVRCISLACKIQQLNKLRVFYTESIH